MIRIINNTDIDFRRLLALYSKELSSLKNIECIVFEPNKIVVWGIDELLLEIVEK
jgi:hypothetical protein